MLIKNFSTIVPYAYRWLILLFKYNANEYIAEYLSICLSPSINSLVHTYTWQVIFKTLHLLDEYT